VSAPRVLVTRAVDDAAALCHALRVRGAEPVHLPLLEFAPGEGMRGVVSAVARLNRGAWIVLTSARAAPALATVDQTPSGVRVAAVGARTTEAVTATGVPVDLVGDRGAESLMDQLLPHCRSRILFLRGDRTLPTVTEKATAAGVDVTELVVYRTILRRPSEERVRESLRELTAVCFTSPSAAEALSGCAPPTWLSLARDSLVAVALGETTATALRSAGWVRVRIAESSDPEALARIAVD